MIQLLSRLVHSSASTKELDAVKLPARKVSMPYLASRIFNVPLLIHPQKLEAILAAVGPRIGLSPKRLYEDDDMPVRQRDDGGDKEQSGPVAVIPVHGTLVKRGAWMDSLSGLTSYDAVRGSVDAAMKNADVKSLLFDIDSPGGEAAGLFDLCGWLAGMRGEKPMVGIANDMAYSAAYALASCMDRLFVTGVGGVGSIGVYMLHVDQSQYDRNEGVTYTYIYSGNKKVDLNPHEPPNKAALAEAQAEVDRVRDMFVAQVAESRGVSKKAVYATEAAVYMGAKALPLLADVVGTFDDAADFALSKAKASRSVAITGAYVGGAVPHLAFESSVLARDASVRPLFAAEREYQNNAVLLVRHFGTLHLSDVEGGVGKISGTLAPYNSMSCNLGGFYEVYERGCFTEFLESDDDALVLAFHNPENVLGRRSNDTAKFWEEEDGLHYEATLPDTQAARDLRVSIERGDVKGSSAAFYITQHRWEQKSAGRVRVVEKARLVEGSPHSFVAYEATTAAVEKSKVPPADAEKAAEHFDHELELLGARLRLLRYS